MWLIYIIKCSDNTLYCGITDNLERRLKQHNEGKGAKYTRGRGPVALVKFFTRPTKGEALKLEYQIKQLSREEKLKFKDTKMKEWPVEKTELLSYSDLIKPVRKALEQAYQLTPKEVKSVPYDGYNVGPKTLVCSSPPDEELNEEGIQYHKDRGRDVMDIILQIAFNLGLEQGRRIEMETTQHYKRLFEAYERMAHESQTKNPIKTNGNNT